jgi:transcriptional regulator with XRE-family HTH domain
MNYKEELDNWAQALEDIEKHCNRVFKKIRYKNKLSVRQFSNILEMSPIFLMRIENGLDVPTIKILKKLIKWVKENDS